MSAAKIRIGILGAGAMRSEHAGSLLNVPGVDVEVAAVFSRDHGRAAEAAKTCGAKPTIDAMEVIAHPAVDVIDVCVPSVNHREFVIAALKHGKHVFWEAPFALSIEDGRAMIDAASNRSAS